MGAKDGVARQYEVTHLFGEGGGPAVRPLGMIVDELMGDSFRLREGIGDYSAIEVVGAPNAEM